MSVTASKKWLPACLAAHSASCIPLLLLLLLNLPGVHPGCAGELPGAGLQGRGKDRGEGAAAPAARELSCGAVSCQGAAFAASERVAAAAARTPVCVLTVPCHPASARFDCIVSQADRRRIRTVQMPDHMTSVRACERVCAQKLCSLSLFAWHKLLPTAAASSASCNTNPTVQSITRAPPRSCCERLATSMAAPTAGGAA